jgi:cell shape-determining protein MreC
MKSHGQNNFGSRRRSGMMVSKPIIFAVAVTVALVFIQLLFPSVFTSTFSFLFSPLWSSKNAIVSNMTPQDQLIKENQTLQAKLSLYTDASSSVQAIIDENDQLKSLLNRPFGAKDLVLASVLHRPPGAGYDYLVTDVGSSLDVAVGNPVYSSGSIAIGQVVEADPHSSKVELYSSSGENYDVLIGTNHIPAVASGQGGGSFSASIARESGVSVGDEVIIPVISSSPFGFVDVVISNPAQPFERILFSSSVNPYQLDWLLVSVNSTKRMPFAGSVASTTIPTSTASITSTKKH